MRPTRVLILGAGPAGTLATILLQRSGFHTTLIEQHRFPRDKVCGECLSALGIEVLTRSHIADDIRALHPSILRRANIYSSSGAMAGFELPSAMWGISRSAMDDALLEIAKQIGVEVLQPARCEKIESNSDRVSMRIRNLIDNTICERTADYAIVADGKGAQIGTKHKPTSDFGLKAHFLNVDAPSDSIGLFGVAGHYGGIAPIESGRWNLAFSIPAKRLKGAGDTDALFHEICGENPALQRAMRSSKRVSDWLVSPLPRFAVSNDWPARIIPVGNAAAALEPVGGEGMGLAMRSAELAVESLVAACDANVAADVNALRSQFRKLWNRRRFFCRAGGMIISSPALSRLAVPFAAGAELPTALALRLVGK